MKKKEVPPVKDAIKAIEEKAKLKRPSSQAEYAEWKKKMDEIDRKYGFL
jgi:hypothetical protein